MSSLSFDSNTTFKVFFNSRKAHKANLEKLMNPTTSFNLYTMKNKCIFTK